MGSAHRAESGRSDGAARRTVVFVVHGIGRPRPGETVTALTHSLAASDPDFELAPQVEVVPLEDYAVRRSHVQRTHLCHVQRGRCGDRELAFFEVNWARPSRAPAVALAALELARAWLGFLVGLRTILHASQDPGDARRPAVKLVCASAGLASLLLIGPVYAMNVLLLIAFVLHAIWCRFSLPEASAPWLAALAGLVAAGIGGWRLAIIGERLGGRSLLERLARSLTMSFVPPRRPLWLWMTVFGVGFAACFAVAPVDWSTCGDRLGQAMLWSFGLASLAMGSTIVIHAVASLRGMKPRDRPRLQAVTVCAALQFGLWVVLVPSLWWTLVQVTPDDMLRRTPADDDALPVVLLRKLLATDGSQWLLALPVVVAAVITWLGFRARGGVRLILPRVASWVLLLSVLLGALAFAGTQLDVELPYLLDARRVAHDLGLRDVHGLMFGAMLAASALIRTALSLGDDVLGYLQKYTARRELLADHPIRSRFRRVVEHVHRRERFDDVFVIAHSQGTVIAIDELAAREQDAATPFRRPIAETTRSAYDEVFDGHGATLVTMGSPFHHLYQHYFPQHYPPLESERWQQLRGRIAAWHNVYRSHDYVGQAIPPAADRPDFPHNHALGDGGHVDYWRDVRLLREVRTLLFGPARGQAPGSLAR